MKMRVLVTLVLGAFLMAGTQVFAADSGKIAVIDMQKVVRQSDSGKKAMEKLNKKFEGLQAQLQKKQDEIKAFKEDMDKKAPLLSDEAKAEKDRDYKKMLRDFKEQSDDAQFEMRQAEAKTMEPLFKELEVLVGQMGKKAGYSVILEKNMPGVYYVDPSVDITDDLIKVYDASTSGKK